eukprot:5364999-Pleurochrysis_carterae.AAC.1
MEHMPVRQATPRLRGRAADVDNSSGSRTVWEHCRPRGCGLHRCHSKPRETTTASRCPQRSGLC